MDDGSPQTFSGPGTSGVRSGYEKQFFDMEKYLKVVDRLDAGWWIPFLTQTGCPEG